MEASFLSSISLFQDLDPPALANLTALLVYKKISAGTVIFRELDESDALYLVENGRIVISKHVKGGVDIVLARFQRADFFGEMGLFDSAPRSATAHAETDAALWRLDRKAFQLILTDYPEMAARICYRLVSVFVARLRVTNEQAREAIRWGLEATGYSPATRLSGIRQKNHLILFMADPAKLEFLTRGAGSGAFQVIELESRRLYWAYKPRRLPATEWEITAQPPGADGARHYVLKNLRLDRYLLLNAREHFLWEYFDGRHSLEEIARNFHLTAGAVDHSLIRQLLIKLYGCGLLETPPVADLQPSLAAGYEPVWNHLLASTLKRWRGASFTIRNADSFCSAIYNRGGFLLFHPIAFWAALGLALVAIALAVRDGLGTEAFAYHLKSRPFAMSGALLVTPLLASMLHTLVHALACKSYGRRVRELGFFMLQGVLPTWYADVTDIFMSSRRARIVVDFAGPMVEVVLGSAAIIGAHAVDPGIGQALLFGIAILLWESALINLLPFQLSRDGRLQHSRRSGGHADAPAASAGFDGQPPVPLSAPANFRAP